MNPDRIDWNFIAILVAAVLLFGSFIAAGVILEILECK